MDDIIFDEFFLESRTLKLMSNRIDWVELHNIENPWQNHYRAAKGRCKNPRLKTYYGKEFSITEEDVKEIWYRDKAEFLNRPSIDRIDNDKGYIKDNIRFIELSENCRKSNKPYKQEQTV